MAAAHGSRAAPVPWAALPAVRSYCSGSTGTSCGPVLSPCSTQHDGTRFGSQVGVIRSAAWTATAVPIQQGEADAESSHAVSRADQARANGARAALTFTQGYTLGPSPNSAISRRRGPSK